MKTEKQIQERIEHLTREIEKDLQHERSDVKGSFVYNVIEKMAAERDVLEWVLE